MSKYEYKPLSPNGETFRLLRILPSANFDDPLLCELRDAELINNPQYAALSYTWGPPIFDHSITVEGHEFRITENLHYALRSFRRTGWQMLWADQICIDQGSTEERSEQVQLMQKIYGKAKAVFISLGNGGENGREVVGLIQDLKDRSLRLQQAGKPITHNDLIHEGQAKQWTAFYELTMNPWCFRTWIVQEAVACANTLVMYADSIFAWEILYTATELSTWVPTKLAGKISLPPRDTEGKGPDRNKPFVNLATIQEFRKFPSRWPLLELLRRLRFLLATDPRDKIYGLLGLASDYNEYPRPDYTKPVEQIYIEFARTVATKIGGSAPMGQLLSEAGLHKQHLTLPTWVPDWSFMQHADLMTNFSDEMWVNEKLNIAKDMIPSLRTSYPVTVEERNSQHLLILKGLIIDKIKSLSPEMPPYSPEGSFPTLRKWDIDCRNLIGTELTTLCPGLECRYEGKVEGTNVMAELDPAVGLEISSRYANVLIADVFASQKQPPNQRALLHGQALKGYARALQHMPLQGASSPELLLRGAYYSALIQMTMRRKFCVTEGGRMGLVPGITNVGDSVAMLDGVRGVMILRTNETESGDGWKAVGDAFIEGQVGGERIHDYAEQLQDVVLW